jgi:outer membrane protein OmpA-like peptidoglycan-associated protein
MRSGRYRIVPRSLLVAALVWSWAGPGSAADDQNDRAITQRGEDGTPAAAGANPTLDDFIPVKTVTVQFGDGKFEISRSQRGQLQQLITRAQGLHNYVISVVPNAPEVGSDQKLSMQRASAVTAILRQAGVPLANVIVVPATDTSQPGASSTKGRAENRRAVVTLLQNKTTTGN